jgi:ribose 5-phosphate isomerase A
VTAAVSPEQDKLKRIAAAWAVEEVEDGMVIGLGSGSTAGFAIEALGPRVAKGLRIAGYRPPKEQRRWRSGSAYRSRASPSSDVSILRSTVPTRWTVTRCTSSKD